MKKWSMRIIGVLLLLVIAVVVYIEYNKEELVAAGVQEANNSINGKISYVTVDISIFRSYPNLKVTLKGVEIISHVGNISQDLFKSQAVSIDIDLWSVLKRGKPIKITSFSLINPQLHLITNKDGSHNYQILKEDNSSDDPPMDVKIKDFRVDDGDLVIIDHTNGYISSLGQLNFKGEVDYLNKITNISSDINAQLNISYGRVLPAYQLSLLANTDIELDEDFDTISIKSGLLTLNDLPIDITGKINQNNISTEYAIDFNSPSTEIKKLISILPTFYKNKYKDLIAKGVYQLNGQLNGSTSKAYPLYNLDITAKNGTITYPILNKQVDNLSFNLIAKNTSYNRLYTEIDLSDLHLKIGQSHLSGNISSVLNNDGHTSKFNIVTDFNLKDIEESIVITDDFILEGKVEGHIAGEALLPQDAKAGVIIDQIFNTNISFSDILYQNKKSSLQLKKGTVIGNETELEYNLQDILYNKETDASIYGSLSNPLAILVGRSAIIKGQTDVQIGTIDLNKLSTVDTTSSINYKIPTTDMVVHINIDKLINSNYIFEEIELFGNIKPQQSNAQYTVQSFVGSTLKGDFALDNLLAYGLNNDTLSGKVNIVSNKINLDDLMQINDDTSIVATNSQELLPDNLNLDITYSSDEVKFKNIDILKSLGKITLKGKKIIFKNEGDIFGGNALFTGVFDTDKPSGYNIDLNLELKDLQFKETASRLKLFSKLIPIAKFLEGDYTTTLKWNSDLSDDYIPDLNSLTAYGWIETQNGGINGLLPIDTFIRKITQIKKGHKLKISDTKSDYIVEDGKVIVKGIYLSHDDIDILIAGSHSFKQELDYQIVLDIPKSRIKASEALNFIQDKIGFSKILNSATDDVKVQIVAYMGGSILRPQFSIQKVNLKKGNFVENIEDQIVTTINNTKDSIQGAIEDTISATTTIIKDKINSTKNSTLDKIDSTKKTIAKAIDSTIVSLDDLIKTEQRELEKEGKTILDSIKTGNIDSVAQKIKDLFDKKQIKIDSLKKKIPIGFFERAIKNGNN